MDSQEIKEKFQQLLEDYHSNRIDWKTFEQQLFELKSLRLGIFSSSEHDATERFSSPSQTASHILPPRFSSNAISKSGRFTLQSLPETSLPLSPESPQQNHGNYNANAPNVPNIPLIPNAPNNSRKNVAHSTATFFLDADSPSRIFRSTGPLHVPRRNQRLDPGTRLGNDYTLQHVLGIGQCGETWLAEENGTNNLVVLKLIPSFIQKDEKLLNRVSNSFRRISKLKYSGICPVFRLTQDEILGSFLVSAFVDALPLNKYYELYYQSYRDFPSTLAVQLLLPISQTLDFAHRKKITHRMLKPQNILIGQRCGVVVTDFELTETIHHEMSTIGAATNAPTNAYWKAPEIWTDHQHYSPYADQFALGVLACQLLSGSLPFAGENDAECRNNILRTEPILDEALPEQTQIVLRKVLAKNPEERFANCYDFVEELSESLTLNPVEQTLTPITEIWPFKETETGLDSLDPSKRNRTFPYAKNPKRVSGLSVIPFNLIFSRLGFIVIFLTITILGGGIVLWKFVLNSNTSNGITQYDDVTENYKNNTKSTRLDSNSPGMNKSAISISAEELERLTRLAEEGNIDAQRLLGEIYFYGNGVKPNYQKAVQFFELGAQRGDAMSLYHIGRCYELGLGGLPRNTTQAISIYKRVKNFPEAEKALRRLKVN
ncbi:MAG: protein kinase [Planctomycetaceae bacterium]|jgi:serine/threonine protein kinase|nr:protein kinase [Planctomycetaceae bacterium]